MVFFAFTFISSASAGVIGFGNPSCAAGDGCVSYSVCGGSAPYGLDPDCNPATCSIKGSGGLIPCGKKCDDPNTSWVETRSCDLCSLFLMGQIIIEFLVKVSGAAALIAISIGGFIYVFSAGNSTYIEKAKSMIKYTLLGFTIVFISWAIIDSILVTAGYIDPIGGEWYTMECTI